MATRKPTWLVLLMALLAVPASALDGVASIPGYQAQYAVKYGTTTAGTFTETYRPGAGGYRLETTLLPAAMTAVFNLGAIHQTSSGILDAIGIQPLEVSYAKGKEENYRFLFGKERIRVTGKEGVPELALQGRTVDELSLMIEMRGQLAKGLRQGELSALHGGKARVYLYHYRVLEEQEVQTLGGPLNTLLVEQTSSREKYRFLFWCAPRWHYLPVKVERTDQRGARIDMVLKKYASPAPEDRASASP